MRDLRVPIWMCQTQTKMRKRKERRKQTETGNRRLGHKVKSFMTVIDEFVHFGMNGTGWGAIEFFGMMKFVRKILEKGSWLIESAFIYEVLQKESGLVRKEKGEKKWQFLKEPVLQS